MTDQSVSAAPAPVHGSEGWAVQTAFERDLARLIVSSLHLEVAAEEIGPEDPLFRDGLGLDSIDALELALAVSRAYGVDLRSDDERNHRIFRSLRSLAAHVASRQAHGQALGVTVAGPGGAHRQDG